CFAPTGRGPMKTQGFERRFSQNLAPVGARKAPKPLLCLHFKFIQQTLDSQTKSCLKAIGEWGEGSGFFKWDWELIILLKTDSV
ncbi:MAG: hypothetical protein ACKPH1_05655, partial [Microcystis panniformis]